MMPTVFTRGQCRDSISLNPDRPARARPLARGGSGPARGSALELAKVGAHHPLDELLEGELGRPPEPLARPARVAHARRALRGAHALPIDAQVALGLEVDARERGLGELGDGPWHAA